MANRSVVTKHGRDAASRYGRVHAEYAGCARQLEDLLTRWLDAEGINYLAVAARAKTVDSFRVKASRVEHDGVTPHYIDPMTGVNDLLAARVITYLPDSVERVCDILGREFEVEDDDDKGEQTRQRGDFGYASRHLLVRLRPQRAASLEYHSLGSKVFEIQVRTAAQHAWAEYEHDLRYKGEIPPDRQPEFNRRFTLAAALMELADLEFTAIDRLYRELEADSMQEARRPSAGLDADRSRKHESQTVDLVAPLDVPSLTTWLTERYGDAPKSKREQYGWMLDLLATFGVASLTELDRLLSKVDTLAVVEAMHHRFAASQIRRLDDDLLTALGEDYIRRSSTEDDRIQQLDERFRKLRASRLA